MPFCGLIKFKPLVVEENRLVRLAYQPANITTLLSKQISQRYFSLGTHHHLPPSASQTNRVKIYFLTV
jgi:hypothetical protein